MLQFWHQLYDIDRSAAFCISYSVSLFDGRSCMMLIDLRFVFQLETSCSYFSCLCTCECQQLFYPFNTHIETTEQRTIIQQYGDWYTGRWWVGCYIWYSSEEGTGRAGVLPSPLLAVRNVTAHPSMASVPTSHHLLWQYNCLWTLKG